MSKTHKASLLTIFLVVVIDLIGFGMMIPVLPYFTEEFTGFSDNVGQKVSWLMMSYSAMQFIFSPFWGKLSDKVGRRPVLLMSILGVGSSMLFLGWAESFIWLLVGRIVAGFFAANLSVASAYIADITKPEDRAKGMGLIGAAFGIGFLLGPPIGGFFTKWGYGTPAFVVAGLSIINFLFALFVLKEPDLSKDERKSHRHTLSRNAARSAFENVSVAIPVILFFLVTTGMSQMETSFALFGLKKFGLGVMEASYILAWLAFLMALIQGGAIRKLVPKYGEVKLLMVGCILMVIGLVGAVYMSSLVGFIGFFSLQAIGYSLTSPTLMSLTSRHAPNHEQGMTMGVYQSAGSLGRIIGPLLAGIFFDFLGIDYPFLIASLFFVVSLIITFLSQSVWKVDPGSSSE